MRFADGEMTQAADERKGGAMSQRLNRKPADEDVKPLPKEDRKRWFVEIDEWPSGEDWQLEIDSPQVYLSCQLSDIAVIERAVELLDSSLVVRMPGSKPRYSRNHDEVGLGSFNGTAVLLLRDNEDFPRCFIVVGPKSRSTLRVSLDEGSIRALAAAFRDAVGECNDTDEQD